MSPSNHTSILRLHYEPSAAVCYREPTAISHSKLTDNYSRTSFSLSYIPLIWPAGNAPIVASLLTWSRDPSPLLPHPSVYSCCLATNEAKRCDAMRGDARLVTAQLGSARLGSARIGSNLLGTEKTPLLYCCVIAGACFHVTVLAWRKYATICSDLYSNRVPP
jgi:hypothetical protein